MWRLGGFVHMIVVVSVKIGLVNVNYGSRV